MSWRRADCVFCNIVNQLDEGDLIGVDLVSTWPDAISFVPLNPVTDGHVLVIPRAHVPDVTHDPIVSATVMARAVGLAVDRYPCNIITSAGREATQTVRHLHLHVVPRREGDGLALPWTGQSS